MTISYRIDDIGKRIIFTYSDPCISEEIDQCYERIFADAKYTPGFDKLFDLRAPHAAPNATNLRNRAERSGAIKDRFSGRTALVFSENNAAYGMGRMYSVFAEQKGMEVRVFTDLGVAETWLDSERGRLRGT